MPKIDTLDEFINCMFREACRFVEFYGPLTMRYYRIKGFKGKNPDKFHPGVADKFLLRKLMQENADLIPEGSWHTHDAPLDAQRILMNFYYNVYS